MHLPKTQPARGAPCFAIRTQLQSARLGLGQEQGPTAKRLGGASGPMRSCRRDWGGGRTAVSVYRSSPNHGFTMGEFYGTLMIPQKNWCLRGKGQEFTFETIKHQEVGTSLALPTLWSRGPGLGRAGQSLEVPPLPWSHPRTKLCDAVTHTVGFLQPAGLEP